MSLTEKRFREYIDGAGNKGIFFGSGISNKKLFVVVDVAYLFVEKDKVDATKVVKVVVKTVTLRSDLILGKRSQPDEVREASVHIEAESDQEVEPSFENV